MIEFELGFDVVEDSGGRLGLEEGSVVVGEGVDGSSLEGVREEGFVLGSMVMFLLALEMVASM